MSSIIITETNREMRTAILQKLPSYQLAFGK